MRLKKYDDCGQIGCGRVVDFIPRESRMIAVPPASDEKYITFTVCGHSLSDRGVIDGDILICRTDFQLSDIKPDTICVIRLMTGELTAKMIQRTGDGALLIRSANKDFTDKIFFPDEVEILALAFQIQRDL